MKRFIALVIVLLLPLMAGAADRAIPIQGTNAIASAGTPERLVADSTLVRVVVIQARKSPTTANTGNVYIGYSSTGGQNYLVLAVDTIHVFREVPGRFIDLRDIYIDAATSADAVSYTAYK